MERKREDTIITTVPPQSGEQRIKVNSGIFPAEGADTGGLIDAEKIESLLDAFQTRKASALETFIGLVSGLVPVQSVIVHEDNIWPAFHDPVAESLVTKNSDGTLSFYVPFYDRTVELQYDQASLEQLVMNHRTILKLLVQIAYREHEHEMKAQIQTQNFMALVHDLRNKMSTALFNCEFLIQDRGTIDVNDMRTVSEDIYNSVNGASRMLEHSVALFADKLNGLHLHVKPTDLKKLLQKVTSEFRNRCDVRYHAPARVIDVDPVHFERVIGNLIHNALKFTDDPAMVVELDVFQEDEFIIIEVRDRGCGLGEDPQRLFNYFQQGKVKAGKGGLGIGLGYCKMICEKFGGTIDGTNNDGGGSTFTVKLPISNTRKA